MGKTWRELCVRPYISELRHRYSLLGHTDNIVTIVLHCHRWDERGGQGALFALLPPH